MMRSLIPAGVALAFLFVSADAEGQGLYPREWWRGGSGLFSRDYVTPPSDEPGYVTGDTSSARSTRGNKLVFAAASVDRYCQQDGSPRVFVLDAPRGSRFAIDLGPFVATGLDSGSTFCLGRTVQGARVYYRGRASHGDRIVLRVVYPTRGETHLTQGLSYDHVIAIR